MHVKSKYIDAILDAIEFINHNIDAADEEHNQNQLIETLSEIIKKMEESRHKRLVRYYIHKKKRT